MENEIINFINVWLTVCASLCYCYLIGKNVRPGGRRLISIFPVVCLFLYLPLRLSSAHLGGPTAFFIAWLANFKLLLFSFAGGPLSSDPPLPLRRFLAVSCLPIKIQRNHLQISQNGENTSPKSSPNAPQIETPLPSKSFLSYAIKGFLVALMVKLYDYSEFMHPKLVMCIYSWHIYFLLEIILAAAKFLARNLLGAELEPQFNDPYFSTSLQDFWGRRWNLMVTGILNPTVYKPTIRLAAPVVGRKWAPLLAVLATFFVSAMMHELIFYYLGRMRPDWEVSRFFAVHGVALTVEILAKKAWPEKCRRVPAVVSVPLTVGFVFVTGIWMFFPQFVRCGIDVKAFAEYAAVSDFFTKRLFLIGELI
ncbi:acyl-CoA--sterol O-acyltransferase 1-like [Momordica charantia]|uniref:Acyl-CoA--sterol O-acyltransferase 1-like n=1 Tax=Momordica charantia TaxID=3673 RepID=A0A6J1DGQ4_MOMCH|nr:acyl-CoA--sterol O-acyltransferase 1-like [Momordica charantia]